MYRSLEKTNKQSALKKHIRFIFCFGHYVLGCSESSEKNQALSMKKFNSVRPAKRWCAVRPAQLVWCQGYPGLSRRVVEEGGGGVSYVQINEGMDGLMKSESTLLLPYHSPLFTKNGFIITRRYWLWFALCDALNFQCFVFPRALARKNVPYHQPPRLKLKSIFASPKM